VTESHLGKQAPLLGARGKLALGLMDDFSDSYSFFSLLIRHLAINSLE
jgi:hypothetical protein